MNRIKQKNQTRNQRKHSVRRQVRSEIARARFSVFRSNNNLYVQIIDDVAGKTLAAASLKEIKHAGKRKTAGARIEKARHLGKLVAEKAKKAGVTSVVFDRGRYAYHGRVQALAEGAREGGLKF